MELAYSGSVRAERNHADSGMGPARIMRVLIQIAVVLALSKGMIAEIAAKKRYVLGFAFYYDAEFKPRVVLIRKNKPAFQAGKLNGVGGAIEPGETAADAMAREYLEEAGIFTDKDEWNAFAVMNFPGAEVICFRAFDQAFEVSSTYTDEVIEHHVVKELPHEGIMTNCRWLIPMAFDTEHREVRIL
ncbi:NUDIX domain-containing protein [candidate division KSB1 bacterium]|nr:NUDIX domain-containing protein [candidate division KSB1 bacterium]